jgi:GNAT superfamily N-acetyltransferase
MRNLSIRIEQPGTLNERKPITELAEEFIVKDFIADGRLHFLGDHSPAQVEQRLAGNFRFYLVEDGHELAGVAAMRSNHHLYYLFVAKPYQGIGLGHRL